MCSPSTSCCVLSSAHILLFHQRIHIHSEHSCNAVQMFYSCKQSCQQSPGLIQSWMLRFHTLGSTTLHSGIASRCAVVRLPGVNLPCHSDWQTRGCHNCCHNLFGSFRVCLKWGNWHCPITHQHAPNDAVIMHIDRISCRCDAAPSIHYVPSQIIKGILQHTVQLLMCCQARTRRMYA